MTRREAVAGLLVVAALLVLGLGLLGGAGAAPQVRVRVAPSATPAPAPAGTAVPSVVRAPDPSGPSRTGQVRSAPAMPAKTRSAPPDGSAVDPADGPVSTDPDRIVVPALSVEAPVVPISAPGGTLVPPSDPQVIGWWSAGARPGSATGTAILTGHTVSTGGGAFDDLDRMRPGQRFSVHSGTASTEYVVRSVTVYPKQSLAQHAAEIFDQTVPGRVALVTCEDWNGQAYLSNAVVVAAPVS